MRTVLRRGRDDLVIERRQRIGKREMSLRVTLDDKTTEDAPAESLLFRLLGLTFDDFIVRLSCAKKMSADYLLRSRAYATKLSIVYSASTNCGTSSLQYR